MTGLWGAATVLIILGVPFLIAIDSLFGTNLESIIDKIMSGGELGLFKVWLCGLPFSFLQTCIKEDEKTYRSGS